MIGESFAIVFVLLVLCFMCLRSKKKHLALLALPMVSVSCAYLAAAGLYSILFAGRVPFLVVGCVFIAAGLLIGLSSCLLLSRRIPNRLGRSAYLFLGVFFLAALSLAYYLQLL